MSLKICDSWNLSEEGNLASVWLRVQITAMAFHPDGTTLASADEDGVVITWDLAQAKQLRNGEKHKAAVWSLSFSNGGGSLLASGSVLHSEQEVTQQLRD